MKTDNLDKVFSEYIRRRDCDGGEYGQCISCGKIVHWKNADAGHYIDRDNMATRFDEQNVHLQCRSCNRYQDGNKLQFALGLENKLGCGIIDTLERRKNLTLKYANYEILELVKYYRQKIKQLC